MPGERTLKASSRMSYADAQVLVCVSVCRIALWHNAGLVPEEIVQKFGHLSLAQLHAALAYYHANRDEIDADLESEARVTEALKRAGH